MSPSPTSTTLDIEGMSCAACASAVEKSLARTPGVQSAVVNYATEKATVHYLPELATEATLKAAVENAGYGVVERAPSVGVAERNAEIDQQKAAAYAHLRRRFWVAAGLAAVIMPLSMLMLWPAAMMRLNLQWLNVALLLLTLPVLLYSGREFYSSAWKSFRHRTANMDTLIAIGTGAAFLYSVAATLAPGFFTRRGLAPEVYFDTTATIIALILLGKVLELRAKTRTSAAIRALINLQAKTARLVRPNGQEVDVPIEQVQVGDILLVRPGEKVATDGLITEGQSALGPDARFFLADSYVKTGDKQQGLTRLRDVVTEGKSEFVNRAVGRLADLEYENKNYAEAAKYYERLRGASTNRREVANATLGQMRSLYEAGDYPGTRRVAEELRAQAGATANATNSALLYLGKASYRAETYDQAATELAAAVAAAPNDVNGAEAQYFLAQTLFKQKKNQEAIAAALKVNSDFSSYPLWQGRAFLLVADVYAADGDNFQARGTLNSLVDNNFPVAEVLEAAKQRLKTLGADQPEETEPVKPTPKAPTKTQAKAPAPTKATAPATKPATPPAPAKGKTAVPRTNLRGTTTAPADTATQR